MSTKKRSITCIFIIVFFIFLIVVISVPNTNAQEDDTPKVLSTLPDYGDTDVTLDSDIFIFFNGVMAENPTKSAFSISPSTKGDFEWHGSGLQFNPSSDLKSNTEYTVTISTEAKNEAGINLTEDYSWTFKTEKKYEEAGFGSWNFWEPIVTGITVLGTILFTLYGVWRYRKRRTKLKGHITRLDEVYDKYRKDPYICEHKLNQLKESLKIKFKSGEMEENHYLIMDKKIDDYLVNIRYRKTLTKPKIIGGPEGEIRQQLEKSLTDKDIEEDDPNGLITPKRKGERKKEKGKVKGTFRRKPKENEDKEKDDVEPISKDESSVEEQEGKPKKRKPPRIVPD